MCKLIRLWYKDIAEHRWVEHCDQALWPNWVKNAARVEVFSSSQLLSPLMCYLQLVVSICGLPVFNVGLQSASRPPVLSQQSPTSEMWQSHLQTDKIPEEGARDMLEMHCSISRQHPAWSTPGSSEHWPQPSQGAGNSDLHQKNLLPRTASKLHSRICHGSIPEMNYVSGKHWGKALSLTEDSFWALVNGAGQEQRRELEGAGGSWRKLEEAGWRESPNPRAMQLRGTVHRGSLTQVHCKINFLKMI